MQVRQLGNNGPPFSILGIGTWAMGGNWQFGWGPANDKESLHTLERAVDAGINWIDTAPAYGLGRAEELVGRFLKDNRQKVFIATKCGLVWNKHGKIHRELSPQTIRAEVEASLRRLQTDVIDLYQIHWPDPARSLATAWRTLKKLQQEGKIRWIGVSNFSVEHIQTCQNIAPVQSVQPPYNLFKRQIESHLLPFCARENIGVLPYSPIMSGLLSGNFHPSRLTENDWRRRDPMFNEPLLSAYLQAVQNLHILADAHQCTVGQLAVAWILQHSAVTSALVGARRPQQLETHLAALDVTLTVADMQRIDAIVRSLPQLPQHQ